MSYRNIMIFGGEFYNKGAQAMSFITISRLKQQFPNHNILFVSELDSRRPEDELENYNFDIITSPFGRNNIIGENLIRQLLKRNSKPNPKHVKKLLDHTEYLFDISGYELSSQWGVKKSKKYLNRLKNSHSRGIKTFILPQSIGPFDYGKDNDQMIPLLQAVLTDVEVIMARENQGKKDLEQIGITDNVIRIPDIVLTNKEPVNWNLIYKEIPDEKRFDILPNSVGIIPNMRNFDHGSKQRVLDLYRETIISLRNKGKNIYLAKHSYEDIEACILIKNLFKNDNNVIVIDEDVTPNEFEKMVEQFDFTIGSRFHSVVHSFKVGVPCLILGWASKYQEVAELFEQSSYVFDVRDDFKINHFVKQVEKMNEEFTKEGQKIKQKMKESNDFVDPFDFIFEKI